MMQFCSSCDTTERTNEPTNANERTDGRTRTSDRMEWRPLFAQKTENRANRSLSLSLSLLLSLSLSLLLSLRAFKCWKRSADAREVQKPPQNLAGRPAISLPLWQRERQMRRRTRDENLHNTRNAFFGPFFAPPSPFPPEKYYNGVKRQMEYSVRPSSSIAKL